MAGQPQLDHPLVAYRARHDFDPQGQIVLEIALHVVNTESSTDKNEEHTDLHTTVWLVWPGDILPGRGRIIKIDGVVLRTTMTAPRPSNERGNGRTSKLSAVVERGLVESTLGGLHTLVEGLSKLATDEDRPEWVGKIFARCNDLADPVTPTN